MEPFEAELCTIAEAARALRVSVSTVWRWINAGRLPAYRVGNRRIRLRKEDLRIVVAPLSSDRSGVERRSGLPSDFEEAERFFRGHGRELARQFSGQYVAIIGSQVIDHDPDFNALARRVYGQCGVRPIFMPRILASQRPIRMPSPRLRQTG